MRKVTLAAAGLTAVALLRASAAPQDPQVVSGTATFSRSGPRTVINASDNAVIHYRSFDIGAAEIVRFAQPDRSSRVLNRITGDQPTLISGQLRSNGHVFLVNPHGVTFADGAVVRVGGLTAAAGHLDDADFVGGVDRFIDLGGAVVNHGTILALDQARLIGGSVANHGQIGVGGGVLALVAGDSVLLQPRGTRISVRIDGVGAGTDASSSAGTAAGRGVENTGVLSAPGGQVVLGAGDLYALAIRNTGRLFAPGGEVSLTATGGETIDTDAAARTAEAPDQSGDDPMRFALGSHPDGWAAPPFYGLRLDELWDLGDGRDVFTFDFEAPGTRVTLALDGSTIHISGIAFGGRDAGGDYDPGLTSFVELDFTYQGAVSAPGDDDLIVPAGGPVNTGSITWLATGEVVSLFDKAITAGFSFRFGNEDNDQGHRGFPGRSGWGWLALRSPGGHGPGLDWLFTAEAFPSTTTPPDPPMPPDPESMLGPPGFEDPATAIPEGPAQFADRVVRDPLLGPAEQNTVAERLTLNTRTLSASEFRDAQSFRKFFNDLAAQPDGDAETQPVSLNRVRRASALEALRQFEVLFLAETADPATGQVSVSDESGSIREALDASWSDYRAEAGDDSTPDGWARSLVDQPEADALVYLQRLGALLEAVEQIGLTHLERQRATDAVLTPVTPDGLTADDVDEAAGVVTSVPEPALEAEEAVQIESEGV